MNTKEPAATLAAIIREADGRHDLSADALACAILAHPDSQWGQAGVMPAAPTFPRISDSLMRSLIGDVLDESETATEAACMDRPYNPVPRIRARLTEILRLAAHDEAKRPAS